MTPDEPTPSRREFGAAVALLAVAPLVGEAQEPKPAPATVADALLDVARARYGKHLTDEQLKSLRASVLRSQGSAERLRKFKLQNGDDPVVAFRADLP